MGLLSALCVTVGHADLPADWLFVHLQSPASWCIWALLPSSALLLPPFGSGLPSDGTVCMLDYGSIPDVTKWYRLSGNNKANVGNIRVFARFKPKRNMYKLHKEPVTK